MGKNKTSFLLNMTAIHMPLSEMVPFSQSIYNMQGTKANLPYYKRITNCLTAYAFILKSSAPSVVGTGFRNGGSK